MPIKTIRSITLSLLCAAPVLVQAQPENSVDLAEEVEQLKEKLEVLADELDQRQMKPAASKTHIGGYGELHYNYLEGDNTTDKKEIDFHRFVLFFSHDYSDRIRFVSELELEHSLAGEGKNGEVELEQAFIDFIDDAGGWRVGLFLLPMGLLNLSHEPPVFYGVERNPVETNIIPTTWWEAGIARYGRLSEALRYEVALHSGLEIKDIASGSNFAVRSGRQKVSEAGGGNPAVTGSLNWIAAPGIELGASAQYQSDAADEDETVDGAVLLDLHGSIKKNNFELRALYALWNIDGSGPESIGADEQEGYYIEPAYRFSPAWAVFTRYSAWDNTAGNNPDSESTQVDAGVNFYPHENVVLKADLQHLEIGGSNQKRSGVNLGVGYQF